MANLFSLKTDLASAMYLGTLDMLSMPPAKTISLTPSCILCAASTVAAMTVIGNIMRILTSLLRSRIKKN